MIHLYWMTWNILSCKISLRDMDKCFSGEWTKMYTSGLWMVFRKQGVTMRAGGLVVSGASAYCVTLSGPSTI